MKQGIPFAAHVQIRLLGLWLVRIPGKPAPNRLLSAGRKRRHAAKVYGEVNQEEIRRVHQCRLAAGKVQLPFRPFQRVGVIPLFFLLRRRKRANDAIYRRQLHTALVGQHAYIFVLRILRGQLLRQFLHLGRQRHKPVRRFVRG